VINVVNVGNECGNVMNVVNECDELLYVRFMILSDSIRKWLQNPAGMEFCR
jgi:hypothetical protein